MSPRAPSCLLRRGWVFERHQDDAVCTALVDQQVAITGRQHVPDDAGVNATGWNGPALESLRFRIESDERIWPLP